MDPPDLEWYTAILNECKSLNINDFLYDVSPYVFARPLPPQRTAPTNVSQSMRPTAVPCRRIVELDIFESRETAWEGPHDRREDTTNLGTLLEERSGGFNQFGAMQGEGTRSELFMDPNIFGVKGGNPVSSSRGHQS
jgi:hypothetical protein